MSKILTKLTALLLAALLLSGCSLKSTEPMQLVKAVLTAAQGRDEPDDGGREYVKFSDMQYRHLELSELEEHAKKARFCLNMKDAAGTLEQIALCSEWMDDYCTMYALSDIYNSLDMTDEYYAGEYFTLTSIEASAQKIVDDLAAQVKASELADELTAAPEWEYFEYCYVLESDYSDKAIELMERESELEADYRALVAEPVITINGTEHNFYEYLAECGDYGYYKAVMTYYESYNPQIAELYIELMRVREELAAELGYDSFELMQYDSYARDYSPEQVDEYLAAIKEYIVPLYSAIGYYDNDIIGAGITRELLEDCLRETCAAAGEKFSEACDFMYEYELCDTAVSTVKQTGAYTTYIIGYNEPYVYIGADGTASDLMSLMHEFGHFLDYYYAYDVGETLDVAECYSLGLEFLLFERLDSVVDDDDAAALCEYKIFDTLQTYVQQASFAEFERRAYAIGADELTADKLNELSLEVAREYGYLQRGFEEYYALSWIDIGHFIEYPFYVLSYTVSNDIALQIYEQELRKEGAGIGIYERMLERESEYFIDFVEECGFEDPFAEGQVQKTAAFLSEITTNFA